MSVQVRPAAPINNNESNYTATELMRAPNTTVTPEILRSADLMSDEELSPVPLRNLRNKLLSVILNLENRYDEEYYPQRIEYAQVDVIDPLLNYLKSLEFHYRDDVRSKNNQEYDAAMTLFREIAEPVDPQDNYSEYRLKPQYRNESQH